MRDGIIYENRGGTGDERRGQDGRGDRSLTRATLRGAGTGVATGARGRTGLGPSLGGMGGATGAARGGRGGGPARIGGPHPGPGPEAGRGPSGRDRRQAGQHGSGLRPALLVAPGLPERLQQARLRGRAGPVRSRPRQGVEAGERQDVDLRPGRQRGLPQRGAVDGQGRRVHLRAHPGPQEQAADAGLLHAGRRRGGGRPAPGALPPEPSVRVPLREPPQTEEIVNEKALGTHDPKLLRSAPAPSGSWSG